MNMRKLASVGLMVATVVVTLTGIFLFLGWGNHYLMVLAHEVFSITFILFVIIHMVLNFKPFIAYLSARKELAINIVISIAFVVVIAYNFSTRPQLSFSDYPDVEQISLEAVLAADGVSLDEGLNRLRAQGLIVPEKDLTIKALSAANKMNPKVIYGTMINPVGVETNSDTTIE